MAEGIFKALTADEPGRFVCGSAGISALDGFPSTAETIRVMAMEADIDIRGHRSRRLSLEMIRTADAIYVMETIHRELILKLAPQASEKTHLLSEFAPRVGEKSAIIDIPDPIRMSEDFYRNVFEMIRDCVVNLVNHLKGHSE